MRHLTIHAMETVSGLEIKTICSELNPERGLAPVSSHTYTRTLPHVDLGDSWQSHVESLAEELFNVAYHHRGC